MFVIKIFLIQISRNTVYVRIYCSKKHFCTIGVTRPIINQNSALHKKLKFVNIWCNYSNVVTKNTLFKFVQKILGNVTLGNTKIYGKFPF